MKNKITIVLISFFLILLFTYTAASKLLEHDRFIFQLRLSPLQQIRVFSSFLSWTVPLVEIMITTILVAGIFIPNLLKTGLWASLILICMFEIYITAMLFSGKHLPCACGGIISLMSWKEHEFFNGFTIILIASALCVFKYEKKLLTQKKYSRV